MKYRIKIERVEGSKFKHVHNIMIETNNLNKVIDKIKVLLNKEISLRKELFADWFFSRKKSYYSKLSEEIDRDLIDWKSKGEDISDEDFLENEMFFAVRE